MIFLGEQSKWKNCFVGFFTASSEPKNHTVKSFKIQNSTLILYRSMQMTRLLEVPLQAFATSGATEKWDVETVERVLSDCVFSITLCVPLHYLFPSVEHPSRNTIGKIYNNILLLDFRFINNGCEEIFWSNEIINWTIILPGAV